MLCNYVFASVFRFDENAKWLEFLCITVLLTFLLLLFGEIMPKVYSRQAPLKFCRRVVGGILFARKLFWPIENILIRSGNIAERVVQKESRQLSVDDLEQALELTDKEELKDEQSILQGIIRFGDETAKEVMTSRQDIVDLDIKAPFSEVLKCIVDNNYSRIPVYQDNDDNIRGVLYIKDLLPHLTKPDTFRWQSLIRSPYFVPETKKIDDLLREFQKNKVHIAIVVDEFGGTSGLVTLEDILEEIVGEINDEYDEEERNYTKLNYNTFIFEGKTLLSDFTKILEVDDEEFSDVEGDADTLAGLLLELKGDFPSIHEKIDYQNYTFEVVGVEERRISRVKVIVHPKEAVAG
jgi:gliding motility-associated protein GldE